GMHEKSLPHHLGIEIAGPKIVIRAELPTQGYYWARILAQPRAYPDLTYSSMVCSVSRYGGMVLERPSASPATAFAVVGISTDARTLSRPSGANARQRRPTSAFE